MVTKDWKKTESGYIKIGKGKIIHIKDNKVQIILDTFKGRYPFAKTTSSTKSFKTKSKALAFARSYMRRY